MLLAAACLLAQSAFAETLAIAHKRADSVGFYDSASGRLLKTVATGVKPHEMALSKDGRFLFVTNYGLDRWTETTPGGNTISIIDVAKREPAGVIDLGKYRRPHGIERGRSGRLYVTCDQPASVLVIDPDKRAIVNAHAVEQEAPHMIALAEDESRIYIANSTSASVTALTLGPKPARKHIPIGGIPMGVALTHDGKTLYAVNRTGNTVAVIDTATGTIVHRIDVQGHPVRIRLVEKDTLLIVTTIEAGDLVVINTRSRQIVHREHLGTQIEGIEPDATAGVVYISAQGDDVVHRVSMGKWRSIAQIKTGARPDPIIVLR